VAGLPQLVPLFPLPDTVLFPQMPLPLHVFEHRYRKMVTDALSSGQKTIGMVLLRPGWESNYEGRPPVYPVGCAGRIEQCEPLPDGRFNILLRGFSRFRIAGEEGREPYRVARVDPLEDPLGAPAEVHAARGRLVEAIARASSGQAVLVIQQELPDDLFVNALCQSLELTPLERQSLLDCDSIRERSGRLVEVLEFRHLEQTHGAPGATTVH